MNPTKSAIIVMLAIAALAPIDQANAQQGYPHHPLCGGPHSAPRQCQSYAMSKAYNRGWSHGYCPASTSRGQSAVPTSHFRPIAFTLDSVQVGDIIGWGWEAGSHACYVTEISGVEGDEESEVTTAQIQIAQVDGVGAPEYTGTLMDVISGIPPIVTRRNWPDWILRKRDKWNIQLRNSFDYGTIGYQGIERPSGFIVENRRWESSVTAVAVMDGREDAQGYVRRFRRWTNNEWEFQDPNVTGTLPVHSYSSLTTFTAELPREFNVTFQNSLLGATGGVIKVNQTIYPAPHDTAVIEDVPTITADAIYNEINRIQYTFAQWNDASTVNPRTFTVPNHATYTASYNAKPLPPAYVTAGGPVGSNVIVSWQMHPHESVTHYQIWRQVKDQHQGTISPPQLLTTVPRTTTQYIDYDYLVTEGYTNDLVWYDVRSYYSLNQTYSDPYWVAVFAQIAPKIATPPFVPTVWSLINSPNPFNPSTRITYSLVEDGAVSLTVYDVQGREVTSLDHSYREAGHYSVLWDGRNRHGVSVGTGVYFVRLTVTGSTDKLLYSQAIKLLLTK